MSADIILRAWKVKKMLSKLATAKENTIREIAGLEPLMSAWDKCCMGISSSIRECMCRAFCPCCVDMPTWGECCCPKHSFAFRLCTDGHYPNIMVKSFLGFAFGSLLAMAIFLFLCLQIEANVEFALFISVCLSAILSLGMAFSSAVRCLVFLALPNTCSSKGRSFLLMYAMVLIMNHPVQNFSDNMNVLTDAATCGQSLALNETKKLVESAASPLMAVIGGIKKMLVSIRRFADDLRKAFKALLRAVQEVLEVMGQVFKWLASIVDVCNDNMGAPYRKCKKVFKDGYEKCSDALGVFDFVCDVVSLVGKVCYIARIGELLCIVAGAVKDLVLDQIGPGISDRITDVKEMFYFNVSINYHYHYNMNQSIPYSEVRDKILTEIQNKLSIFVIIRVVLDNVMPLTVSLVVVKALLYRRSFLLRDNYDNKYVTRHLFLIDDRRKEMEKECVLPLKQMEQLKYIPTFSYKLTKKEAKKLVKGVTFWSFTAFHAIYYMICDYGLYWILDLISYYMDFSTQASLPPHLKLHVKGQGPMSDMFKAMVGVLEPVSDDGLDVSPSVCLPHPSEPAWGVYKIIIAILILTFFLTLFEAYGMRLRHAVAACYYPDRERARAVWLYNNILSKRGGFLVFARRQLHRKRKDGKGIAKISMKTALMAKFPFLKPFIKLCGHDRKHCMSCGSEGNAKDMENFSNCDNCNTVYCNDCFQALGNVCTFCMAPVEYGDVDDEDVETDSSFDDDEKSILDMRRKAKKKKIEVKQKQKIDPDQMLKSFQQRFGRPKTPPLEEADGDGDDGDGDGEDDGDGIENGSPRVSQDVVIDMPSSSGSQDSNDDDDDDENNNDDDDGDNDENNNDDNDSADDSSDDDDEDDDDYSGDDSTSSYDTDYQHRSRATTSESEAEDVKTPEVRRGRMRIGVPPSVIRRPEKVTMDIFRRDDDGDY